MSPVMVVLAIILIGVGVVALTAVAQRIRVSAPLLIIVVAVGLSFVPWIPNFQLDPDVVLFVLLPPLLYAAARGSSLIGIRRSTRPIGLLAIGLVIVTALAVGAVTHALLPDSSWGAAIALGAVVAPPDAVAATAVARRTGLPRGLVTLLEGESLFNDATALVLLRVSVAAAVAGAFSPMQTIGYFLLAAVGGVVIGLIAGYVIGFVRRHMSSPLLTTGISIITPFAVYLLAEAAYASGVIAVVMAGLLLAHRSPMDQSPAARLTEESFWATIQLLLEGAVFALIGLQLTDIIAGVSDRWPTVLVVSVVVLAVAVLVRPAWVFGLVYVARIAPWAFHGRPKPGGLAVVSWAGMRGVVSLAAAQTLPLGMAHRDMFVLVTMVVILFTLGVQGATLPGLIRRVGVMPPDPRQDALAVARAQQRATDAAKERLTELGAEEKLPDRLVMTLRKMLDLQAYSAWEQLGDQEAETPTQLYRRLRREVVTAQRGVLIELRGAGELEEELLRDLQRRLDLEESLLPEHESIDSTGHQEVLPERPSECAHLKTAPKRIPDADPRECEGCVAEGRRDWVHLRICLDCNYVGCCDSSPRKHASLHYGESEHPVMGSAERGEHWRWCFVDQKVG
jgi:monovalent cation/hydrogen antiporter